jgi:hypothetical protein
MDIWGAAIGTVGGLLDDLWVTDEEKAQSQAQLTTAQAAAITAQTSLVNAQNAVALEAERTKRNITVAVIALGGIALLAGAWVFARGLAD